MKNRKVLNVRSHVGGLHGKTSYDAVKDRADMEVCAVGVVIKKLNGQPLSVAGQAYELLIPWPNCTEVLVEVEEEEEKRGPGRPPKAS